MSVHDRSPIGLALAGGGPLGIAYEIGALLALEEALRGVTLDGLEIWLKEQRSRNADEN